MAIIQEFVSLELDLLHREAAVLKTEGWRFMQTHAVNTDEGVDLYYSFMKDGRVVNYRIEGVKNQPVPSITDLFLAAFVFENEARELFGVDMRDIAIDFEGAMYAPAESAPMTFMSPEQKAARDKAKKAAAEKAAKDAAPIGAGSGETEQGAARPARSGFVMTPERQARLDAKLATMSPDKVAKVQAALKAREAEAAAAPSAHQGQAPEAPGVETAGPADSVAAEASGEAAAKLEGGAGALHAPKDAALEAALSMMEAEKADKVRLALGGKAPDSPAHAAVGEREAVQQSDEQVDGLLALLGDAKAAVVRAALEKNGGE